MECSKANLRAKFTAMQAFFKNKGNLNKHPNLRELEKEEQTKPKFSRRKEVIIKIRGKINRDLKNNRKKQNHKLFFFCFVF